MYGIVNKSLRNRVIREYCENTWEQIFKKFGLESGVFIHLNAYPDQITYYFLGAASEILNTSVNLLLQALGQQWPTHSLFRVRWET